MIFRKNERNLIIMTNTTTPRTLTDLTTPELHEVLAALKRNERYNDIKSKYNLASNSLDSRSADKCIALIKERTPVEPTPEPTKLKDYARLSNTAPRLQKELYDCGAKVDSEGKFYW